MLVMMDFEQVLRAMLEAFEREHVRYGVLGGFALGVLKVPRTTVDLDLLVHRDDLMRLEGIVHRLGYLRRARTENVTHYAHPDAAWGAIDILHAFRAFSLAILERAQRYPIFDGVLNVNVLQPEDVIGFKVQGMANNPLRATKELVDIEALMAYYGKTLDWARIQEYFELFELGEQGCQLHERFGQAQ